MYCVLLLGSSGTGLRILCCRAASESRMAVVVCPTLSRREDEVVIAVRTPDYRREVDTYVSTSYATTI